MHRHATIPAVSLLVAAGLLAPLALPAAGQPTLTTIVLDGSLDDWQTVQANPFNVIYDGDGNSIPCGDSSDRDCIVPSGTSDLQSFAFTWDQNYLYIMVRRFVSANNKSFLLYIDRDNDGRMESTDWVLYHLFKAAQDQVQAARHFYNPANAAQGDLLEDALGFGDGYTLPGTLGAEQNGPGDPGDCTTCLADFGRAYEFAWSWIALGMTPGQAFGFHVSGAGSSGGAIEDNMAGRFGLAGSTRYHLLTMDGALDTSSQPQLPVNLPHRVFNSGNADDSINLSVISALGLGICIYDDPDIDLNPDTLLGCDQKGDGDFTGGGDFLAPGADSDGDTKPDSGSLAPGGMFPFVVQVTTSNQARGKVEQTTIRASSAGDPAFEVQVVDGIAVGDVTLYPERRHLATAGVTLPLAHHIQNHLLTRETFDLQALSREGWSYEFWSDPDGDGDPSDGAPLFDTNGDTNPDVNLIAGGSFDFVALATVPGAAMDGTRELVSITASSNGNLSATVTDSIGIQSMVQVDPDHTFAEGTAKTGGATYPVFFRHTLSWAGDRPQAFDLLGVSTQGFPVDFYTDPDGDGNPSDGVLLTEPAQTPPLDAWGGEFHFLARVSVPSNTPAGVIDTTTVYALSQGGAESDQATDETRVALVQVFEDPAFAESISHTPVCATVYGRVRGLLPSQPSLPQKYRIVWEDPSSGAVRITPIATDRTGEGFDQFDLGPTDPLGLWAATIQEYTGGAWVDLDRAYFEAENPGSMDALYVDPASFSVLDTSMTVAGIFRNNGLSDLGPMDIGFRILTPSRTEYLDMDGAFRPFTGVESTWLTPSFTLTPDQITWSMRTIADIAWTETGFHTVEAHWQTACGATVASANLTFFLDPDLDTDTLDDLQELGAGLDPTDRDTDDDGLPDGLDGLADTDGDTVIDGLQCDADGDGLTDGLEAGVTALTADPDTDQASVCFAPDADGGATTTDPKDGDTDNGGIPDGQEDKNLDGFFDPGEGDPNDPADDTCSPAAPEAVTNLQLRKDPAGVRLAWDTHPDPCASFRVLSSEAPDQGGSYQNVVEDLLLPGWVHAGVLGEGVALRGWLVQAVSPVSGDGPLDHFGL